MIVKLGDVLFAVKINLRYNLKFGWKIINLPIVVFSTVVVSVVVVVLVVVSVAVVEVVDVVVDVVDVVVEVVVLRT